MSSVISAEARGASTQSGAGGGQLRGGRGSGDTPSPLVERSCGPCFSPWGEGAGRGIWLPEGLGEGSGAGAKRNFLKSGGFSEHLCPPGKQVSGEP